MNMKFPACLALGIVLSACGSQPDAVPSINTQSIKTVALQNPAEAGSSRWDGVIEAVQQAELSAQTSGRVNAVLVDVNDRVSAEQLLIKLTAVEQQAGANTALAQVAAAKAQAVEAESNYTRFAKLAEQKYVSRQQLDQALAARNSANAQVLAAQAQADQASQQTRYTQIRAPFAGIVSARHVEPGESIGLGQALMTVFNPDNLRIEVQLPQSVAEAVRRNPKARIEFDDGKRMQAAQVLVFPSADAQAHSVTVRIALPADGENRQPGQVAKVVFDVPNNNPALMIPRTALWQRGELTSVYVITDNAILLRQVRLGEMQGDRIEVLSGLKPEERIATNPGQAAKALAAYRASVGTTHD